MQDEIDALRAKLREVTAERDAAQTEVAHLRSRMQRACTQLQSLVRGTRADEILETLQHSMFAKEPA